MHVATHEQTVWCTAQEADVLERFKNHPARVPFKSRQARRIDQGQLGARDFQEDTLEFLHGFLYAWGHRVHGLSPSQMRHVFWGYTSRSQPPCHGNVEETPPISRRQVPNLG